MHDYSGEMGKSHKRYKRGAKGKMKAMYSGKGKKKGLMKDYDSGKVDVKR